MAVEHTGKSDNKHECGFFISILPEKINRIDQERQESDRTEFTDRRAMVYIDPAEEKEAVHDARDTPDIIPVHPAETEICRESRQQMHQENKEFIARVDV